jgi:hypothetical protein
MSTVCLILLGHPVLLGQTDSTSYDEPRPSDSEIVQPLLHQLYRVTWEEDRQLQVVIGELIASNPKNGNLFLDADGQLLAVTPDELKRIEDMPNQLVPTNAKELAAKTLKLMPQGSKFITTDHFVICFNTSEAYARWNASLYERLFKGFYRFWKEKGVELETPRFPMVALVFETRDDYVAYASNEFKGAENTIGYYHQSTNRLASYDLTGMEGMIPAGAQVHREELLNQILSRPQAERTVATIVHEACHQIAFNSGLQVRLGDNPLWLSEGIAMFFESPDLTNANGWGGIGKVNRFNLNNLGMYLPNRKSDSLEQLLLNDDRLRQGETATASYAEAWGLTFHLLKSKPKQFVEYLSKIRAKAPGQRSSPKERMEMFQDCFGHDLAKVDKDFLLAVKRLR